MRIGLIFDARYGNNRDIVSGVIAYARSLGLPWIFAGGKISAQTWRMLRNWHPHGIIGPVPPGALPSRIPSVAPPDLGLQNNAIGRLAAEHLIERKFRHLAFVGEKNINWSAKRAMGFHVGKKGLEWPTRRAKGFQMCWQERQANNPEATFHRIDIALVQSGDWRPAVGELAGWLQTLPKPVGILACDDLCAREISQTCRLTRLRIPDDVAIVGVGNDDFLCELTDPPLSSISVPWDRIGYQMGAQLHGLLQGRRQPKHLPAVVPISIKVRRSSAIYAVADEALARACRYMQDHAYEPLLQMETVTRVAGVSRRGLERRFHRELGRSPHAEIQRLRLERARQMLRETSLPLTVIAERCGWSSVQRFMAIFKAQIGQTPGQFRSSGKFKPPA